MKFVIVFAYAVAIACSACKSPATLTQNDAPTPPQPSPSPTISHSAQKSNCSLTKAEAPVLNSLKLGMTTEEVLAVFPASKDDPELQSQLKRPASPLGVSSFVVRPERLKPESKFAAFSQFTFNLLDGRVSSLNIGYNGPAYSHVDQFVTKIVEGTNLPSVDVWQAYSGMDNQLKILTCKGFEVRVFADGKDGNLNYVALTDLDADKQLKDRRAKARAPASSSPVSSPIH